MAPLNSILPCFLFKPVLLGTETFVPPVHYSSRLIIPMDLVERSVNESQPIEQKLVQTVTCAEVFVIQKRPTLKIDFQLAQHNLAGRIFYDFLALEKRVWDGS